MNMPIIFYWQSCNKSHALSSGVQPRQYFLWKISFVDMLSSDKDNVKINDLDLMVEQDKRLRWSPVQPQITREIISDWPTGWLTSSPEGSVASSKRAI